MKVLRAGPAPLTLGAFGGSHQATERSDTLAGVGPRVWLGSRHPGSARRSEAAPAPKSYTDEPWFSLWSALCHQGDVYSASLAAVPELISIAGRRRAEPEAAAECLLLAGCIEMDRHTEGAPSLPEDLAVRYREALQKGGQLAAQDLQAADPPDQVEKLSLSLASFRGDIAEARRIADGADCDQ